MLCLKSLCEHSKTPCTPKSKMILIPRSSKISEMYNMLIAIQSRLPDTRHNFFQDPMSLEDAYGRKWPIPVEYDYQVSSQNVGKYVICS